MSSFSNNHRTSMRRYHLFGLMTLLAALAVLPGPTISYAQEEKAQTVRSLVIKDNQVMIDGNVVDRGDIPGAIELDSVSVSYSFIGIDDPVVNLNNHFFAVRSNRLELIPAEFRTGEYGQADNYPKGDRTTTAEGFIVDSKNNEYYSFQGERLKVKDAVPRLLNEANNLYLDGLQQMNQSLFSRLAKERVLELEAARLAERARHAADKNQQALDAEALRAKLAEIFELKQSNRRAEIAQFERQLDALRDRVERREALKAQLIKQRLDLLIGNQSQDNH